MSARRWPFSENFFDMDDHVTRFLVNSLCDHDYLTHDSAAAFSHLLLSPIARPKGELVHHLTRYADLREESLPDAIDRLVEASLIVQYRTSGMDFMQVNPDWSTIVSQGTATPVLELEQQLAVAKGKLVAAGWSLSDLGAIAGNREQYLSWVESIRGAKIEIVIWTMSSAYPEVLRAVGEASARGVPVCVLLGSYHDVNLIRGPAEAARARQSAHAWAELAEIRDSLDIRTTTRENDLCGAGSTLIDRKLMRFTVYDFRRQTGSSGRMIEIHSNYSAHSVNLVAAYEALFAEAWPRSNPHVRHPWKSARRLRKWLGWHLLRGRSARWILLTLVCFAAAPVIGAIQPTWAEEPWFETVNEALKAGGAAALVLALQGAAASRAERKRLKQRRDA